MFFSEVNVMAVINLVKWDTNNPRLLVWKFPSKELSTWTQLIVNDSQEAWLVHQGNYEGPFEAGRHVLSTENLPIISNALNLPYGSQSPFTAEVWFVTKTEVLDLKWGTIAPMQLLDPVYGVLLPVRAFSQYGLRVVDSRKLLAKLVGTANLYTADQLNKNFQGAIASCIKSHISELIIKQKIPIFELSAHLKDISAALPKFLNEIFGEYGVEVIRFSLMSVNVPENDPSVIELKDILANKAKLSVLGSHYQQVRSLDVLDQAAQNEGTAGAFMGFGMGAAFNQSMFGTGSAPILNPNVPPMVNPSNENRGLSWEDRIRLLKELGELRKLGILTEAEFNEQKARILQ